MHFKRLIKLFLTFLFWLSMAILSCEAQHVQSVISKPEHQRRLNEFISKADAYCAKNLNRFGLDELQKYDKVLDSLVAKEREDTLASIQKIYVGKVEKRKAESGDLKAQLEELNANKELFSEKYHRLLRKAGLAFVIWLVLVLLLLAWRKRLVKNSQADLDANLAQLKISEEYYIAGEDLFRFAGENQKKVPEINQVASELQSLVVKTGEQFTPAEPFKILQKNSEAIRLSATRFANLTAVIIAQHEEPVKEKKPTNINQLCEQYTDLVYSGMLNADGTFTCQLSKDFEKNLPPINIVPEEIGSLLIYVLGNAFQSINEKLKKEIKGYVPKVSISTRILPRFVQIRVKDNSDGITDDSLDQIYEPFFSTRPEGEGAGLGLYFSQQIIKENNGEIKIESETGNGTDVYIKFFLQS